MPDNEKMAKDEAELPSSPTRVLGAPGSVITQGYIEEDEVNANLRSTAKYRTYSDLLANISIVSAGVRYYLNLVAKAKWKVSPASDSEEAIRLADLVNEQMTSMRTPWHRIVRRSAMYRFYGFSVQEWTAEAGEDGFRFVDVAPRPQITIERWERKPDGEITAIGQRNPETSELVYIPRSKCVYLVDDSLNDSPEGLGLFRHIVESCARLQRYEQLEGFGFESDLRGIPIGRAPFAALAEQVESGLITRKQADAAAAPISKFITNHIKNPALGILVDSLTYQSEDDASTPSSVRQWDVELLKGSSSSLPEMANAIERVNREIARTLGVEGLLLGEQTAGSHALSKDKSLNFALIVDSTLQELADAYQTDVIERLFDLNGWAKDEMPIFSTEQLQHRDITQITQALKDISASGSPLAPNDPAVNEIRQMLGLADQPEMDQETIERLMGLRSGAANTTINNGATQEEPPAEPEADNPDDI
jgi:hypothetical protein